MTRPSPLQIDRQRSAHARIDPKACWHGLNGSPSHGTGTLHGPDSQPHPQPCPNTEPHRANGVRNAPHALGIQAIGRPTASRLAGTRLLDNLESDQGSAQAPLNPRSRGESTPVCWLSIPARDPGLQAQRRRIDRSDSIPIGRALPQEARAIRAVERTTKIGHPRHASHRSSRPTCEDRKPPA